MNNARGAKRATREHVSTTRIARGQRAMRERSSATRPQRSSSWTIGVVQALQLCKELSKRLVDLFGSPSVTRYHHPANVESPLQWFVAVPHNRLEVTDVHLEGVLPLHALPRRGRLDEVIVLNGRSD